MYSQTYHGGRYTCPVQGIVYRVSAKFTGETPAMVQCSGRADTTVPGQETCGAWFSGLWIHSHDITWEE